MKKSAPPTYVNSAKDKLKQESKQKLKNIK